MLSVRDLTVRYGRTPAVENSQPRGRARGRSSASSGRTVPASRRPSRRSSGSFRSRSGPDHVPRRVARRACTEEIARRGIAPCPRRATHLRDADRRRKSRPRQDRQSRSRAIRRRAREPARRLPDSAEDLRHARRSAVRRGTTTACDRAGLDGRASAASAGRALARSGSTPRRSGLRRCRRDPERRGNGAARRAEHQADGGARRPELCHSIRSNRCLGAASGARRLSELDAAYLGL